MTFVRLAGCPNNCIFCDTDWKEGKEWRYEDITDRVQALGNERVCITGGEPLAHPEIEELLTYLYDVLNHHVHKFHVETSGTIALPPIIEKRKRHAFWLTVSPKPHCLEAVIEQADEVKWLFPVWSEEVIKAAQHQSNHYIQPVNYKHDLNNENVKKATQLALKLQMPLSIQVHKLMDWR